MHLKSVLFFLSLVVQCRLMTRLWLWWRMVEAQKFYSGSKCLSLWGAPIQTSSFTVTSRSATAVLEHASRWDTTLYVTLKSTFTQILKQQFQMCSNRNKLNLTQLHATTVLSNWLKSQHEHIILPLLFFYMVILQFTTELLHWGGISTHTQGHCIVSHGVLWTNKKTWGSLW